jgi:O-antigen ligase
MQSASYLFLWLLTFIMPWEEMFIIPGVASFAKALGVGAVFCGAAALFISGRPKFPIVLIWPALFVVWCCLSISWAADSEKSLGQTQTYVLLLTLVWLVCQFTDNPKRLKGLMRALVLGITMMVANTYLGHVSPAQFADEDVEVRVTAENADANAVAFLCALGIMFSFYLLTRREKSGFELPKWFYWGFIVAASLAALRTGSRGGLISLAVGVLALVAGTWGSRTTDPAARVLWKVLRRSRLGIAVCLVLVGVLVPPFVARSTIARIAEGTDAGTFDIRLRMWEYGWEAWKESPILGVGAGCFNTIPPRYGEKARVAHNTFISVLAETGLVGFALYFLYWGMLAWRCLRLPSADRYFWLGIMAVFMPIEMCCTGEYWKVLWLVFALIVSATAQKTNVPSGPLPMRPFESSKSSFRSPRPRPI